MEFPCPKCNEPILIKISVKNAKKKVKKVIPVANPPNPDFTPTMRHIYESRKDKMKRNGQAEDYVVTGQDATMLRTALMHYTGAQVCSAWDLFLYDYIEEWDKNRFWRGGYTISKFLIQQCFSYCMEHNRFKMGVKHHEEKTFGIPAIKEERESTFYCDNCIEDQCEMRSKGITLCKNKKIKGG